MTGSRSLLALGLLMAALLASSCLWAQSPEGAEVPLPPFPADDPKAWVCQESPPPATVEATRAWCTAHPDRGQPARLGRTPATVADLRAKNRYDDTLRGFLRDRAYRKLGWVSDRSWRLTGPYVGPFKDGMSFGVHPAVRVWYSPEIADWLCAGRPEGGLPDGAMIIKEMAPIDPTVLGIEPERILYGH